MTPAEVARAYLGSFASGDPDAVAAWVTDDFVNEHTSAMGSGCTGRDEYRRRLPGFLATMSGLAYEVESLIAEGDDVAAAYTMRARFQDKPFEVRGVQRLGIRGDRVARRTDYWDSLVFLLQVDPSVRERLAGWL